MTDVVVEAGPGTVRGPRDVPAQLVSAALECIDDELALIDDRPAAVADVWREVMRSAVGACETVVLVCPTWWASRRVNVVRDAAADAATDVVVLQRAHVLADELPARMCAVVEIAPELVVVSRDGRAPVVIPRLGDPDGVAEVVAGEVGATAAVLVDAAVGVNGAGPLAVAITDRVRAHGVSVSIAGQDWVRRAMPATQSRQPDDACVVESHRPPRRAVAVLAGVLLSLAALCAGFSVRQPTRVPPAEDMPLTLLVEGRIGVKVPAQWRVQRITSGPGSARVQIVSPADPQTAVHVTQSPLPPGQTPAAVAETLRTALEAQPLGVFVDFDPADRRADRPVMTYREIRAGHHIAWTVLVDDSVRIGIGCQSAVDHEDLVRLACEQAIGSAHAVF
ncbi:MAG: type VII secretion-associated protein [Mycobacterium sp.]